jgi:hypothetical protein
MVRPQKSVELLAINRGRCMITLFQFGDVLGWRNTTDNPIRSVGKRCFVDDRIKDIRLYAMSLAPVLRKDVMYIDIFTEEDRVVEFLPRTKILGAVLH